MAQISELEKDFKRLVKETNLAHAYALHGQVVSAQFSFAKSLANFLETKKWEEPTSVLLDAKFIDGDTQKLGVEVAREFSDFLYRQPVASEKRTLIINSAAEFTDQAQNAILKIVEEPPSHALIILTLRDVNSLLPALKSRLQAIYVAPEAGMKPALTPLEERAQELVEKFLMSASTDRSKLLKGLVDEDKEAEKSEQIVDAFVRELLLHLSRKPEQNVYALKELLKRQTAMGDYSTSRKLQLEAALQYLK
jgi:DNA polymerase III delta prime subunit